ncbi:hypothetical protein K501DRAFT_274650 [Backusella circina FSU 941]|nr:hypothetical protein K501DRAFT_274650 [Backusella circina FSU 941]
MTTMDDFVLADELRTLQEGAMESYYIPSETVIRGKNEHDLYRYLNDITDGIEVSSENISDPLIFDKIRSFLKAFPSVPTRISSRLFDIVLSAFKKEIKSTAEDIKDNEKETFHHHKNFLELYGFIIHWFLLLIEDTGNNVYNDNGLLTSTTNYVFGSFAFY